MNIVFVHDETTVHQAGLSTWRGEMYFKTIKKIGLHNVDLINAIEFSQNIKPVKDICSQSQIIIIEGSPTINLLDTVNYWKSKGKKVVVDIPISAERLCSSVKAKSENGFSIAHMFTNYQTQGSEKIEQSDTFLWGLHLADCILVSSIYQQDSWQSSAPIRIIPELIDLELLRDTVRNKSKSFVIGIMSNVQQNDPLLFSAIKVINTKYPEVKWMPLNSNASLVDLSVNARNASLPSGFSYQWPGPVSLVDMVLFWDSDPIRGEYYRHLLELMAVKIPWVINGIKGYQDLSKYGLIVQNNNDWQSLLIKMIDDAVSGESNIQDGYVYALGHNVEDHIHEVLSVFSEIIKNPS